MYTKNKMQRICAASVLAIQTLTAGSVGAREVALVDSSSLNWKNCCVR